VRSAIERVTRDRVLAAVARSERQYICECCDAPVHVVRAETIHFAHRRGRARPDCEQYFPGDVHHTGWPLRPVQGERHEGVPLSYLAFDMGIEGPELSVWLPPANDPAWPGSIRLVASSTRTVRHTNLDSGMRIPFLLHDGQWTLSAIGHVAEEYLSKLTLGRQTLESERNLFYAFTSTGRRVEPTDSIRLGDSVWWVRRANLTTDEPLLPGIERELHWEASGWRVYLITLPSTATPDEVAAFSQWLQRRVRPQRPVVWVASPWPRQILPDATAVFAQTDGTLEWRANQSVDFRLIRQNTGGIALDLSDVTEVAWGTPEIGNWYVEIDQVVTASIQIVVDRPAYAAAVLCVIPDRAFDIVELQRYVDTQRAGGAVSVDGVLRWESTAVANLLSIRNHKPAPDVLAYPFVLSAGSRLVADNLAYVSWPVTQPPVIHQPQPCGVEPLARWLASIGARISDRDRIRLRVCARLREGSQLYEQLAHLSWPISVAPQVRMMQRALEGDL
jgi:hypothetical protein